MVHGNREKTMSKGASRSRRAKERKDVYLPHLEKAWPTILRAYHEFKALKPIIEYRLREGIVCAFPASPYIDDLTERTREQTRKLYEEATAQGKMMVFISDSRERVLRSYVFAIKAPECAEGGTKAHARRKRIAT